MTHDKFFFVQVLFWVPLKAESGTEVGVLFPKEARVSERREGSKRRRMHFHADATKFVECG